MYNQKFCLLAWDEHKVGQCLNKGLLDRGQEQFFQCNFKGSGGKADRDPRLALPTAGGDGAGM